MVDLTFADHHNIEETLENEGPQREELKAIYTVMLICPIFRFLEYFLRIVDNSSSLNCTADEKVKALKSSLELSSNGNEAKAHRLQVHETGEEVVKTRESAVELEHLTCIISRHIQQTNRLWFLATAFSQTGPVGAVDLAWFRLLTGPGFTWTSPQMINHSGWKVALELE